MTKRETDFWRLLLGDAYPENTLRIDDTFYLRDGNVVIELGHNDDGVSVTAHAGFVHRKAFAFFDYFAPNGASRLTPRLELQDEKKHLSGPCPAEYKWYPARPKQAELEKLYTDLRAYIALWIRRK